MSHAISSISQIILVILSLHDLLTPTSHALGTQALAKPTSRSQRVSLQKLRDEFNSTENPATALQAYYPDRQPLPARSPALKRYLLRLKQSECCPSWPELSQMADVQEEQRRLFGKARAQMGAEDLLNELSQVFVNITYYSIDGQEGQGEWQKYYKYYDNVQYYLRLVRVCESYLSSMEGGEEVTGSMVTLAQANSSTQASKLKQAKSQPGTPGTSTEEAMLAADRNFKTQFKRQLKSIQFRVSQDPIVSSFIGELSRREENFELYENFIKYTQFGQYYARNISMARESIRALELVGSHLGALSFPSNLTRPSKVYEMMRALSSELFRIKNDLFKSVSARILTQRLDVRRAFSEMDNLVASRPDIRMLGDEFGTGGGGSASPASLDFSANVRKLTHLLDLYVANNMTHMTFYDKLSGLPEEFILLGLVVAREFETKELPDHSKFNSDYYNWQLAGRSAQEEEGGTDSSGNSTGSSTDSARSHQGARTLLSRMIFG